MSGILCFSLFNIYNGSRLYTCYLCAVVLVLLYLWFSVRLSNGIYYTYILLLHYLKDFLGMAVLCTWYMILLICYQFLKAYTRASEKKKAIFCLFVKIQSLTCWVRTVYPCLQCWWSIHLLCLCVMSSDKALAAAKKNSAVWVKYF